MNTKKTAAILVAALVAALMLPTAAFAETCSKDHSTLGWHTSSSGSFEHFKACPEDGCDYIADRGNHVDGDDDRVCDVCGVDELCKVTYDYEDPSKADVVLLFEKGAHPYHYSGAAPYDQKEGYASYMWEISYEKTPESSLSVDSIGQKTIVADGVVMVAKWAKVYEAITFTFSGYELGADVNGGTLADDIDGYEPYTLPGFLGGGKYAIVADKDGQPDMTDPDTMLKLVSGSFEAGTDYWLMVMIGGEGRHIDGDTVVNAYDLEDYFLASPECVDKYRFAEGEAELVFFKLKPLENPAANDGVEGDKAESGDQSGKPTPDSTDKQGSRLAQTNDATPLAAITALAAAAGIAAIVARRKLA